MSPNRFTTEEIEALHELAAERIFKKEFYSKTYTNTFPQDEGKTFTPVTTDKGIVMQREDGAREYLYNTIEEIVESGRWASKE